MKDRISAGQEPYGLAVTPDGEHLYVADLNANEVTGTVVQGVGTANYQSAPLGIAVVRS